MGVMPYLAVSAAIGVATVVALYMIQRRPILDLVRLPIRVVLAGLLGIVAYSILLIAALALAEERHIATVMLINYLWPIEIVLLSLLLLDRSGKAWLAVVGALVGFAGVAMARGPEAITHPPESYLPHLLAFIGSLLWAGYSVLLRKWGIPAEKGGSTLQFAILAIVAAFIATVGGHWRPPADLDAATIGLVILGGVGPIGLAYYWWEIGVKQGAVRFIALLAYFIPVGSAALIGLYFHESMSPWLLPAAGLITAGALLGHVATREAG
jgi:drug/metabolite transporter (DMT)-like permease